MLILIEIFRLFGSGGEPSLDGGKWSGGEDDEPAPVAVPTPPTAFGLFLIRSDTSKGSLRGSSSDAVATESMVEVVHAVVVTEEDEKEVVVVLVVVVVVWAFTFT